MEDGQRHTATAHFVLVPFMAQGHHIPMMDLAQLLADRGVVVSFVTTPLNAARLQSTIDEITAAGLPIQFVSLRFPCSEVGLPDGCENLDVLPSKDSTTKLLRGAALLRSPLTDHLRQQAHSDNPPTCLVSDAFHPWTAAVARDVGIPRVVFHGTCCFSLLCLRTIKETNLFAGDPSGSVQKTVPGLPHEIKLSKAQVPGFFSGSDLDPFRKEVAESERESDGVVVNSFQELEQWYAARYQEAVGKKVWTVGPLSVYKTGDSIQAVRGNKSSVEPDRLTAWLDSKRVGSVVYASFGSIASLKGDQMVEIGVGLERSGHPFVWVVKGGGGGEVERWLDELQERNGGRCFLVRGWAPQAVILSHRSVGGFVTHCGWNSTLEGLASGVPMAMWPRFAEQFLNAKLVVEVLGVGVAVGAEEACSWAGDGGGGVLGSSEVENAVRRIMAGGERMRKRAEEVAEMATKAMAVGGSSYRNVSEMIEEIGKLLGS